MKGLFVDIGFGLMVMGWELLSLSANIFAVTLFVIVILLVFVHLRPYGTTTNFESNVNALCKSSIFRILTC